MHRPRWLFLAVLTLVPAASLWTGCSSLPSGTITLHQPYATSRDGVLQYRLPVGWYDATADSQSTGQTIWLLRSDYSSTIAVLELHVDADAREDLHVAGIEHLARLTMALAAGGKPYVLQRQAEDLSVNGAPGCRYELAMPPGDDVLRVIVFDTGMRVYMVTALVPGDAKRGLREEVFPVQDAFVSSLRW